MRKIFVASFGLFLFTACMVLGAVAYIPEQQLVNGFSNVFSVATGVTTFGLLFGAALAAWIGLQLALSAHHRQNQRKAEAMAAGLIMQTAPAGDQVYAVHLGGLETVAKPLHLSPAQRINGPGSLPTNEEVQRWAAWQAMHAGPRRQFQTGPDPLQLPAIARPVDLLAELDNVQRCLIVGASDSGKTTLLKHIMARRLTTSRVIAIDPHAAPGKWPAHKVFGVGRDYDAVSFGLAELLEWMIRRYDDIGRGKVPEMGHPAVTVLVDEWRAIVKELGPSAGHTISTLLTESRKAAFSVFVATHSERVKALGIEGEGDLKDGFAIVRLALVNGQRVATLDKGQGPVEVQLPGPFAAWQPPHQIEATAQRVKAPDLEPTGIERRVLALAESGASKAQICEQVWGYKSSKLYPEIDRIIDKFSRAPVHVHRAPGENEAVHGAPEGER